MLFKCEDILISDALKELENQTKESYSHEEIFGEFCNIVQYIHRSRNTVFKYLANIFNMEEWTFSIRDFKRVKADLYLASDVLVKDTPIYFRIKTDKRTYSIEHQCAWDQSKDLWMRYHFHLLDAMPLLKKPGTILTWLNVKHPYYYLKDESKLPKHIVKSQHQKERTWIGEYWKYFPAAHRLEANNLRLILET